MAALGFNELNGVSVVDNSILGVSHGWLMDMGLIEVPTNIPCTPKLALRKNSITRIEADSFGAAVLPASIEFTHWI